MQKILSKQSLKFYLTRLKNASFSELIHRVEEAILTRRLQTSFTKGGTRLKIPVIDQSIIETLQLPDFQYYVDDQTLRFVREGGVFTLNGDREKIDKFEEDARGLFCADVPRAEPGFDIQMAWGPARLQHLTILLLYADTNRGLPGADRLQATVKK